MLRQSPNPPRAEENKGHAGVKVWLVKVIIAFSEDEIIGDISGESTDRRPEINSRSGKPIDTLAKFYLGILYDVKFAGDLVLGKVGC